MQSNSRPPSKTASFAYPKDSPSPRPTASITNRSSSSSKYPSANPSESTKTSTGSDSSTSMAMNPESISNSDRITDQRTTSGDMASGTSCNPTDLRKCSRPEGKSSTKCATESKRNIMNKASSSTRIPSASVPPTAIPSSTRQLPIGKRGLTPHLHPKPKPSTKPGWFSDPRQVLRTTPTSQNHPIPSEPGGGSQIYPRF